MKRFGFVILLLCFVTSILGQNRDLNKEILGKWCNPYTYESTGELKGFEFKKGGKCRAVNIPSLDLKTWKIDKDGYLTIEGFSKEQDGTLQEYKTRERIGYLTTDTLELVSRESSPRISFLYLNTKVIKKRITPEVASDEKK